MQIFISRRYKLKEGCKPSTGPAIYGTDDLNVIGFDSDRTVLVCPDGFSLKADFWAACDDLEEMD